MADEAVVAKDLLAAEFGRRGGKARFAKLNSEERRMVAQRAARARWAKKAGTPSPTDPSPTDPRGPQHRDVQGAEAGIM